MQTRITPNTDTFYNLYKVYLYNQPTLIKTLKMAFYMYKMGILKLIECEANVNCPSSWLKMIFGYFLYLEDV